MRCPMKYNCRYERSRCKVPALSIVNSVFNIDEAAIMGFVADVTAAAVSL